MRIANGITEKRANKEEKRKQLRIQLKTNENDIAGSNELGTVQHQQF